MIARLVSAGRRAEKRQTGDEFLGLQTQFMAPILTKRLKTFLRTSSAML